MSKQSVSNLPYQKVRSRDRSDPGFRLPGKKLRWVSAKQTEVNMDRPWAIIRRSMLPEELLKHLDSINPGMFTAGDTVRRGDLILAYCSDEAAIAHRKELDQLAEQQKSRVHGQASKAVKIYENEIEKVGADLFRKEA